MVHYRASGLDALMSHKPDCCPGLIGENRENRKQINMNTDSQILVFRVSPAASYVSRLVDICILVVPYLRHLHTFMRAVDVVVRSTIGRQQTLALVVCGGFADKN